MDRTQTALTSAKTLLQRWSQSSTSPEPNRLDIYLKLADLLPSIKMLYGTEWGYLSAITGLDPGVEQGELEVLYHFCCGAAVVTLRVSTPREEAVVPTVCGIIPAASIFERELSELFGIVVEGAPDPTRLLLPDNWPEGLYPLRKDLSPDAIAGALKEQPHA